MKMVFILFRNLSKPSPSFSSLFWRMFISSISSNLSSFDTSLRIWLSLSLIGFPFLIPIAMEVSALSVSNPGFKSTIFRPTPAVSAAIASGLSATYPSALPVCTATLIIEKSDIGSRWLTPGIWSIIVSWKVFNWATIPAPVKSSNLEALAYFPFAFTTITRSDS